MEFKVLQKQQNNTELPNWPQNSASLPVWVHRNDKVNAERPDTASPKLPSEVTQHLRAKTEDNYTEPCQEVIMVPASY